MEEIVQFYLENSMHNDLFHWLALKYMIWSQPNTVQKMGLNLEIIENSYFGQNMQLDLLTPGDPGG